MSKKLKPFLAHSELTDCIYIIDGNTKYDVTEQCISAMKATNRMQRWITVSERLPESSGVYIVSRWFTDGFIEKILTDACYFDGTSTWHDDNRINHDREYVDKKIVAWMPLPEPYKKSEGTE